MRPKMHSKIHRENCSFNLKTLSVAVISTLLFSNVYAAGLGKLTVMSSLGQPLQAEIELASVSKDEVGALVAKLASVDTFRQANIDFNAILLSLRFNMEQRGTQQFIRVTSVQPLNEPFVDMLVELAGPNGRLIREYTFLLDPPDLRSTYSPQVGPTPISDETAVTSLPQITRVGPPVALPELSPGVKKSLRPTDDSRSAKASAPLPESGVAKKDNREIYKVKNGDSLTKIAASLKAREVSLDQMLVALYRANSDAFVDKNINRLRSGQILSIPDTETARNIDNIEARNLILAHASDFNNYKNKLAGQVVTAAPQKSVESKQASIGKITAKVEEQSTPATEAKDKLKLSKAIPAAGQTGKEKAAVAVEEKIAHEKSIAEANARVKELERNVGDLQKMLEVKNKSLAEQQKQADASKEKASKPTAAVTPATPIANVPSASSPVSGAPAAVSTVKEPTKDAAPVKQDKFSTQSALPPPVAVVAKPKSVPPVLTPEPNFTEEVMGNPFVLPGLGALLVGLGALGIYSARHRKQKKQFEDSIITDSSLKANSLFGSTGGQSVDTNNSVFSSSFAPSASHLDTNEVDPVAEADVYIAYGRDAQAEEILKEALRTQPDRNAVRVKLLEIYSNRKDLRSFEVLATELYGLTKGEGEDWMQAASLGIAIDPSNPLYSAAKSSKDSSPLNAPTQPLDEQGLATLLAATQSNTSLETISDLGGNSAYFSNTAAATEIPMSSPEETKSDVMPSETSNVEQESVEAKTSKNELDFDLDGMDLKEFEVPNTIPRPAFSEPDVNLASINFDFLPSETGENVAADTSLPAVSDKAEFSSDAEEFYSEKSALPQVDTEASAVDASSLAFNLPVIPEEEPNESAAQASTSPSPLDFDLSGISLELNPAGASFESDLIQDIQESVVEGNEGTLSADAEMATKLDLAVAYQEIGDKEGARELLDEVVKGGTTEQSEKAKSLLMELA